MLNHDKPWFPLVVFFIISSFRLIQTQQTPPSRLEDPVLSAPPQSQHSPAWCHNLTCLTCFTSAPGPQGLSPRWSFATLLRTSEMLFRRTAPRVVETARDLDSQHLANIAWAYVAWFELSWLLDLLGFVDIFGSIFRTDMEIYRKRDLGIFDEARISTQFGPG